MKGIAISVFLFSIFLMRVLQLAFLEKEIESFWLQLITIDTFGQLFFFLFFSTIFGVVILSQYIEMSQKALKMKLKEKGIEKSKTDEW